MRIVVALGGSALLRRGEPPEARLQHEHVVETDQVLARLAARHALARLQVRYPEVQVVFPDSRKFAEEWTYLFLAGALADATGAGVE